MEIVIAHMGNMSQLVPALSVIKRIKKQEIKIDITWVVKEENLCYINKYNRDVKRTITLPQFSQEKKMYDLFINLYPIFPTNLKSNAGIRNTTGFCFCEKYDEFKGIFLGENSFLDISVLQLYFMLCGFTWKGEGYNTGYYPKTKSRKNRVGISVANANLRNYVLENLELEDMKVWYIPYKKNIFRKMDEINRCKKIITDDLTTLHLAISMRKYVYYLNTFPLRAKLELFNNGQIHKVPTSVFQ
ncbi:MAG: hypothetical protein ACTSSP_01090 [Candidatus Asgardarchaeia archaeon]